MAGKRERKDLESDFMPSTESCEKSRIKIYTCAFSLTIQLIA